MQGWMSWKVLTWGALAMIILVANWKLGSRQAETEAEESADEMVRRAFGMTDKHKPQLLLPNQQAVNQGTPSAGWERGLVLPSAAEDANREASPEAMHGEEAGGMNQDESLQKDQHRPHKGLAKSDRHRHVADMKLQAESRASAAHSFKDSLVKRIGLKPPKKATRNDKQAEEAEKSRSSPGKGKASLDSPMDSLLENLPEEELSYEKRLRLSTMSKNLQALLSQANGQVKRCKGPKTDKRPDTKGLPIKLIDYVPYEDIFVHQKNYKRLYPRNYTEMRHPHLLPESAEDLYEKYGFRSCTIVGNSGAMLYAKFGSVIDHHDVVFRLNQAPTGGYEPYVGRKATFRLLNSLWTHRYSTLKEYLWGRSNAFKSPEHMLDATQLPLEKDASLIVSRCSVTEYSKLVDFWATRRTDVSVLMLNSRVVSVVRALSNLYRVTLCKAGWGPFEGGGDPSSGLVASYLALQLCGTTSVYGFGSERVTDNNERTPYHYYRFYGARKYGNTKAHSFDTELNMMAELYDAQMVHPFKGHRLEGWVPALPGNARMCRTERGYIVNTHNLQCQGGKEDPAGPDRIRKKGKMTHKEWQDVETLHHSWEIPLPVQEL